MPAPLTVLITCKDEQSNIAECIASVRDLAEEILIADSGSRDRTLQIVASLGGCKVIQRDYVDSGNFKNWAIPQAKQAWVLVVDADERVTPELSHEIRDLLRDDPKLDGYAVYRTNHFMGHPIRYTSWGRDRVIRLVRRDLARYREHTDHTEIDLPARQVGELNHRLIHYTCWQYDPYLRKLLHYTEQQAELWYRQGRRPSLLRLTCQGPLRFFRSYVLELGLLDGLPGFQVSMLTGFYSFLKQARLWQKWYGRQPDSPV
jgi:(heptosyl)LPS beta-1,4-glucosyltransferase